jgi:hypothetical protein
MAVEETLAKLETAFAENHKTLKGLVEAQQSELKEFGVTTTETAEALTKVSDDMREIQESLKEVQSKVGEIEAQNERLVGDYKQDEDEDVGARFVKSESYERLIKNKSLTSEPVSVKSFYTKTLTSDQASAGVLVQPYRRPGVVIPPDRPLRIRDLMNVQRVTSDAVEYVREIGYANVKTTLTAGTASGSAVLNVENAEGFYAGQNVLLDGTIERVILSIDYDGNEITLTENVGGSGVAEGDTVTSKHGFDAGTIAATPETLIKPEMTIAYDLQTEAVKTIAHWIPASRQIMADASILRSRINDRLVFGLKFSEEHHILYGDGSSRQLAGILTDVGRQTYNWSSGGADDTKVDAIRRAVTKAMLAYYPVNGVVLHPNDWEDIELLKGSDKHYIWVTVPDGAGVMRVWGVPVVVTTAINEGEFVLGGWRLGATLWDREDASIRVAEQHENFFIRNMVLVLAEERLVQTVERPESFVHGFFDAAPSA